MLNPRIHFLLFALLLCRAIVAADVELFGADGKQVWNYNDKLRELDRGDVLKFPDGAQFQVVDFIGRGSTTQVIKVKSLGPKLDGDPEFVALRVPLSDGNYGAGRRYTDFIGQTLDGLPLLQESGVATPKIHRFARGQYIALEMIDVAFNARQFFHKPETIDEKTRAKAEAALLRFARSTWRFRKMGDFGPHQLVYSKSRDEWVLVDWTPSHETASAVSRATVWESFGNQLRVTEEREEVELSPATQRLMRKAHSEALWVRPYRTMALICSRVTGSSAADGRR